MNVNKIIIEVMLNMLKFSKGTKGGHKLENLLAEELADNLKGFKLIDARNFKEYYDPYKSHISNGVDNFNFKNITLLGGYQDDNLIIEQPRGSQNTPDILIVHKKIGIPIECKTNSDDKIVWNSGYPRDNYIYLFNKYKGINISGVF